MSVAIAIAIGLSGCGGEPASPIESEPWTPPPPVFESKDAALEAGRAAYQRYLDLSALIGAEGGADPERLSDLMTPELAETEIDAVERFAAQGRRVEGANTILKSRLVQYDNWLVQLYVCLDATTSRVFDSAGVDVTPPDRPATMPMLVSFDIADESGNLTMSRNDQWLGPDAGIC